MDGMSNYYKSVEGDFDKAVSLVLANTDVTEHRHQIKVAAMLIKTALHSIESEETKGGEANEYFKSACYHWH